MPAPIAKMNGDLDIAIKKALGRGVPMNYILRALRMVEMGYDHIEFKTFDTHYEGEAYQTVSGQNSNNSVTSNERLHARRSYRCRVDAQIPHDG